MRLFLVIVAFGFSVYGLADVGRGSSPAEAPAQEGQRTLLGTLAEWTYPGSEMPEGARTSDGGNPRLGSVKCQAILTTPDPVETVMAFYSEKLGVSRNGEPNAEVNETDADAKSVSILDNSNGHPVTLRLIVVNEAKTSTTRVISRAEGETQTQIAWTHDVRRDEAR